MTRLGLVITILLLAAPLGCNPKPQPQTADCRLADAYLIEEDVVRLNIQGECGPLTFKMKGNGWQAEAVYSEIQVDEYYVDVDRDFSLFPGRIMEIEVWEADEFIGRWQVANGIEA